MSLIHLRWFSQTLEKQVETHVIYPDCAPPPHPVLYLLHGLSDDSSNWTRFTRLEQYAQPFPMLIVMPDGFRGFYTDNEQGPAYGAYLISELPDVIERIFRARSDRGSRAIGGLSMGGYGALRAALERPDRYCSVHSHSGALTWGSADFYKELAAQTWRSQSFVEEMRRVFGPEPDGSRHDLFALARAARRKKPLPKIRLDCGREDYLIEANRRFSRELASLRIAHEYIENDGGHDWAYWDRHIQGALEFHAKNFQAALRAGARKRAPGG